MKIIVTKFDTHFEVWVKDGSLLIHSYAFNSMKEVEAFYSGFAAAKHMSNNLIQSLPSNYEIKDGTKA